VVDRLDFRDSGDVFAADSLTAIAPRDYRRVGEETREKPITNHFRD
jgi:hypothetical protein